MTYDFENLDVDMLFVEISALRPENINVESSNLLSLPNQSFVDLVLANS